MAKRVDTFIKMFKRLYSGSNVDLENLTHVTKLESFLRDLGKTDGTRGFEKLEEIGGAFQPGECFDVDIRRDEQGAESVKLIVRGKEYGLDRKRLAELVELYEKMNKEE